MIHFGANTGNNFQSLNVEKINSASVEEVSDKKTEETPEINPAEISAGNNNKANLRRLDLDFLEQQYSDFPFYGENTKPYHK